jgi:hypothetical protein
MICERAGIIGSAQPPASQHHRPASRIGRASTNESPDVGSAQGPPAGKFSGRRGREAIQDPHWPSPKHTHRVTAANHPLCLTAGFLSERDHHIDGAETSRTLCTIQILRAFPATAPRRGCHHLRSTAGIGRYGYIVTWTGSRPCFLDGVDGPT